MADPLTINSSNIRALNQQYETIAHNLANASSAGFKRGMTSFTEVLQSRLEGDPAQLPESEIQTAGHTDWRPGVVNRTGQPLDMALHGKGFFVIETQDGPEFTRAGTFRLSPERQLVDSRGRTVAGDGGPITIPPNVGLDQIQVAQDGSVLADGTAVGKLRVVEFDDVNMLTACGGSCYKAPPDSEVAAEATTVMQGYREMSNVSTVQELTALISVTRLYEANIKTIQTQDERLKNILQIAMS
ncbi:MAG: flagellar hook-basal body protein [Phycisphaerae bacterium]